jgi:hypothetical protein
MIEEERPEVAPQVSANLATRGGLGEVGGRTYNY